MPGTERQNSMFQKSRGYVQKNNPFPVTSCGRRRSFMVTDSPIDLNDSPLEKRKKRKKSNEPRKTTKGKNRNFRTVKEGAGMTAKGVKEYRRKNPGSKAAKRRKSFCARSKGWTGERGRAARRRWRC